MRPVQGDARLHIDVRKAADVTYVSLIGRVDHLNANALALELDELHDDDNPRLVLDLRCLTTNVTGRELIARAENTARNRGKDVSTIEPSTGELSESATG